MNDLDIDLDRNTPWVDKSACVKFGLDRPSRLAGHTEHRYRQTNRQTNRHNAFYYIDWGGEGDPPRIDAIAASNRQIQRKYPRQTDLSFRSLVPVSVLNSVKFVAEECRNNLSGGVTLTMPI